MKKGMILLLAAVIMLSSCRAEKDSVPKGARIEETTKAASDYIIDLDNVTVSSSGGGRCIYGARTGTSETYTGLEPLEKNPFDDADTQSDCGLPKDSIAHSFGVASGEKPHEISVRNQSFFDEKQYDAVCYDIKTTEKKIYLTFDCGYENGYTERILDTLKEKKVQAAFFCTLYDVESNPELIARMIKEGHIVGNHSVTHPDFSVLTRHQMYKEVKGFDDYLREHFGYSSLYFRFPQGVYNEEALYLLNTMGYRCVFWSLAYDDWDPEAKRGAEYALKTVTDRLHPGAVILLHSVSPDNAEALGSVIDSARQRGYEFCSLNDM